MDRQKFTPVVTLRVGPGGRVWGVEFAGSTDKVGFLGVMVVVVGY